MRPLVKRHCWAVQDPDQRLRKIVSRCAIRYYEEELNTVQQEQYRHAYTVELLYHKLYLDVNEGYRFFQEHFSRVIDYHLNAFACSPDGKLLATGAPFGIRLWGLDQGKEYRALSRDSRQNGPSQA